jgi:hypothetical protein
VRETSQDMKSVSSAGSAAAAKAGGAPLEHANPSCLSGATPVAS